MSSESLGLYALALRDELGMRTRARLAHYVALAGDDPALRAVEGPEGRCLVAVSASEETAVVRVPEGWRDEHGAAVDAMDVAEGEVRVLRAGGER